MTTLNYIPLAEVPAVLGRRVHINSLLRWVKHGSRGLRLRADFISGRWFTTPEWVREFVAVGTSKAMQRATAGSTEPAIVQLRNNQRDRDFLKRKFGIDLDKKSATAAH